LSERIFCGPGMQIAEAVKIRVHGRSQTNSTSVPDRSG
jgi:hypothetical protein